MKHFLKGRVSFGKLETEEKQKAFMDNHKAEMQYICNWFDEINSAIQFGFAEDGEALCVYDIAGQTKQFCKGIQKELFTKLKRIHKFENLVEISGQRLY